MRITSYVSSLLVGIQSHSTLGFGNYILPNTILRHCSLGAISEKQHVSFAEQNKNADDHSIFACANQDTTNIGNLIVPSVGVGTISWSKPNGLAPNNGELSDLQRLVNTACVSNAAFFDTAERYGSNLKTALGLGWGETESLYRELLQQSTERKNDSSNAVIATKFTPTPWRTTVESVVESCNESRKRLGVDQIDLYQLHMPDIVQPLRKLGIPVKSKDEVYWDGLAECYHRGLVKNVGVCNYGPTLLSRCQEALAKRGVPLASNQIAFSLIGRHNGAQQTLDKCNELGIKVLAYYPFAMGLLTGKYGIPSDTKIGKITDKLMLKSLTSSTKTKLEIRDLKRYMEGDGRGIPTGGIGPLMKVMEVIAKTRGKTVAQVALNYIICKGAIPIPGARTEDQLIDNMGAMNWRLSDIEVEMLEAEADDLGFGFDGAGFKRTSEKFVGYGVEKWALD